MKKHLINTLIILLLFVITFATSILTVLLREGEWGISKGLGILLTFVLLFGISAFSLTKFERRISLLGIILTILIAVLLLNLPKAIFSTAKFSLKVAPYYIALLLGILSGYLYWVKEHNKFKFPLIIGIFPLIMAFGTYDLWVHKIEYGNWTGEVDKSEKVKFAFLDKNNNAISDESLSGKVVLLDFWFISCGPCWVKFPDLQRLHDKYSTNSDVKIYAVNRPMKHDEPGELFTSIEEKGYSFPVLKGSEEAMDSLNIYKYPTVILLNKEGELIFMGELEDAEAKLATLL